MEWVSLVISLISLAVAIFIAYNQTRINIEKIIERDYAGQLTKAQALALSNLYIVAIKKELTYQVHHFLDHEFHKFKKIKTPETMQNSVHGKYKHCIREIREQFSTFKMKGGIDFIFVIETVNEKNSLESRKKILELLVAAHEEEDPDTELIKSRILSIIRVANERGEKDLKEYIHRMY